MPASIPIAQRKIALLNSGNVCAFPECDRALVLPGTNSDPAAAVGEIAHIVAASRQGPRGNVDLDDESRNLAENLIVLCPEHHTTIDAQPRTYSIPVLRQMKADHERRIASVRVRGRQTGAQGHEFVSERLYSTLLPITHIPSVVFAAPSPHGDNEYESIKEQIRSARSRWLLPFLLKDGLLLTFYDLRVRNNPFKPFIRGDVQRFPARDLWYDPEGSRQREGNMAAGITTRVNGTSRTELLDRPVPAGSVTARPPTNMVAAPVTPIKLLRFPVVRERTGLSRSTIWRLERRGEFPKHHRIAPNIVAWSELEVSRWIDERLGDDGSGDREPAMAGAGGLSRNG